MHSIFIGFCIYFDFTIVSNTIETDYLFYFNKNCFNYNIYLCAKLINQYLNKLLTKIMRVRET